MWPTSLIEALNKEGYRVVLLDNRDSGRSHKFSDYGPGDLQGVMTAVMSGKSYENPPYLLKDMAADAAALLDVLGIEKAHVAGASMGGMIVQEFGINHANKAHSIVSIMSTTGRPGLPQATPEVRAMLANQPVSKTYEERKDNFIKMQSFIAGSKYPSTKEQLESWAERVASYSEADTEAFSRQFVAILSSEPRHEKLANVNLPALVIHGTDDKLIDISGGEDTAKCIPGAKFVSLDGAGHDVCDATLQLYLDAMVPFFKSVDAKI